MEIWFQTQLNVKIVDIGVGSEHVLALTDQGEVYGWGNNFNSQLGLEPGIYGDLVAKPILINFLNTSSASPIGNTTNSSTKNIQQVSAGNLHSVIYSSPLLTPKSLKSYGIPEKIPEKFETIQHIPVRDLQERLISLNEISNLVKTSWRLLPRDYTGGFTNNNKNIYDLKNQPLSLNSVRQILNPSVYQLPLVRTLQSTMTIAKQALQQVTVKRYLKTVKSRRRCSRHRFTWNNNDFSGDDNDEEIPKTNTNYGPEATIFAQVSNQVMKIDFQTLRLPSQAWKVKLVGEGADDAGG